jgi:N-acetylmuramoyl-L-alanine amidase
MEEGASDQLIGGVVRAVKVMAVDARTTRMILELDPDYGFDPHHVKVWGLTDQQWVVQLPPSASHPDSGAQTKALETPGPLTAGPLPPRLQRNQVTYLPVSPTRTLINGVQATTNGFFLPTQGSTPQIQVYRTRDPNHNRQLVIDVLDAALPPQLNPEALPGNRYGIDRWALTQFATIPPAVRITLSLNAVSPDWQISLAPGGIALTPVGVAASQIPTPATTVVLPVLRPAQTAPTPVANPVTPAPSPSRPSGPDRQPVVIMLDPGHGGADPGAIGIGGLQEKGVVWAVTQQVAAILRQQGLTVQMTRQGDQTLDLQPRVDRAEAARANLFVSIHANAVNMQRPEVNGLETYYFSDSSLGLARVIHQRVLGSLRMNDRGVKQARFFVLRRTSMPSVLIELGFVTGATDAPNLRNPQWQTQMAQAIAQGILDYLRTGS